MSELKSDEYILHYAELPLSDEIKVFKFKSYREFSKKAEELLNDKTDDRVYLYTMEGQRKPILIHKEPDYVKEYINGLWLGEIELMEERNFYIQEYETYKDAFMVGLDMHEPDELCYENKKLGNRKTN